jgi:hypothetical protein
MLEINDISFSPRAGVTDSHKSDGLPRLRRPLHSRSVVLHFRRRPCRREASAERPSQAKPAAVPEALVGIPHDGGFVDRRVMFLGSRHHCPDPYSAAAIDGGKRAGNRQPPRASRRGVFPFVDR